MGIEINPEPDDLKAGCLRCFDPDETPVVIWAVVTGVRKSPGAPAELPGPPNGIHALTHTNGCIWHNVAFPYVRSYSAGGLGTQFLIGAADLTPIFSGFNGALCAGHFINSQIDPEEFEYIGGEADVYYVPNVGEASLALLAGEIGLDIGENLFAEPFVVDNGEIGSRYADIRDHTNILVHKIYP